LVRKSISLRTAFSLSYTNKERTSLVSPDLVLERGEERSLGTPYTPGASDVVLLMHLIAYFFLELDRCVAKRTVLKDPLMW